MAVVILTGEIDWSAASAVLAASARCARGEDLTLLIDSPGGALPPTFAIVDRIRRHRGTTIGRTVRRANSAAALVLSACSIRSASAEARFTLHETALDRPPRDRLTATSLRRAAAQMDRLDRECRTKMASFIGCDAEDLAALESAGATLSAQQALNLGLLTTLLGCPALTRAAADRRRARAVARQRRMPLAAPNVSPADFRKMARAGLVGVPLGIARPALSDMISRMP